MTRIEPGCEMTFLLRPFVVNTLSRRLSNRICYEVPGVQGTDSKIVDVGQREFPEEWLALAFRLA